MRSDAKMIANRNATPAGGKAQRMVICRKRRAAGGPRASKSPHDLQRKCSVSPCSRPQILQWAHRPRLCGDSKEWHAKWAAQQKKAARPQQTSPPFVPFLFFPASLGAPRCVPVPPAFCGGVRRSRRCCAAPCANAWRPAAQHLVCRDRSPQRSTAQRLGSYAMLFCRNAKYYSK